MFSARYHENLKKDEQDLYYIFANGFVIALLISFLLIVFAHYGGPSLFLMKYSQPGVLQAVQFLVWSIPLNIVSIIIVSATKALIIMKWDAIIQGFLVPFSLLVFSLIGYFYDPGLPGLLFSYLLSSIFVAVFSLFVFAHYFSFLKLFQSIIHYRLSIPFITFAIPQNLNMTFNMFITNLDVIMLGYFGYKPEVIGFYGMGAQVVRNIRQIKLAFSGVYAPVITRLYSRKDYNEMNHSFSMVSRWTAMVAFPLAMIVALFKDELLLIFHSSFTMNTNFMILLLIPPLLSCTVGLAGNIIVMTGYSLWNLTNSLTVALVNATLNYFLIPLYGLMGAALATAIAASAVSIMQLIEARYLIGAYIMFSKVYKPYISALPGLTVLTVFLIYSDQANIFYKIAVSIICIGSFLVLTGILKLEAEDKRTFFFWRHNS